MASKVSKPVKRVGDIYGKSSNYRDCCSDDRDSI